MATQQPDPFGTWISSFSSLLKSFQRLLISSRINTPGLALVCEPVIHCPLPPNPPPGSHVVPSTTQLVWPALSTLKDLTDVCPLLPSLKRPLWNLQPKSVPYSLLSRSTEGRQDSAPKVCYSGTLVTLSWKHLRTVEAERALCLLAFYLKQAIRRPGSKAHILFRKSVYGDWGYTRADPYKQSHNKATVFISFLPRFPSHFLTIYDPSLSLSRCFPQLSLLKMIQKLPGLCLFQSSFSLGRFPCSCKTDLLERYISLLLTWLTSV